MSSSTTSASWTSFLPDYIDRFATWPRNDHHGAGSYKGSFTHRQCSPIRSIERLQRQPYSLPGRITHFFTTTFVFLSGLSAYLASQKKNFGDASLFLVKRGLWLIFVEVVIIMFGLSFDYRFSAFIWQVIWAIGCSMIILGLVRLLPNRWTLVIGCLLFFGHDLFNYIHPPQHSWSECRYHYSSLYGIRQFYFTGFNTWDC